MATNTRDPRSLITPDAFSVSEDLLGLPLAGPGRRLVSILIDLLVIGILTVVTADLRLVIWGIVGLFFVQMTFRRPGRKMSNVTAWLFRGATGCLGFLILSGVGIGYLAIRLSDSEAADEALQAAAQALEASDAVDFEGLDENDVETLTQLGNVASGEAEGGGFAGILELAGRMVVAEQLEDVDDPEEARGILFSTLDAADEVGMEPAELAGLLEGLVTEEAEFTDDPESFRSEILSAWADDRGVSLDEVGIETPDDVANAVEEMAKVVADLTPSQVLTEWARRVDAGDTLATDPRAVAVRGRASELIAGDSLDALARQTSRLESQLSDAREDVAQRQAELEEGQAGVVGLLRDIWEQLGSAFGLWSIYFTVMLSMFGGRTVGKIATGTKVVRLDGEPINWWAAFERCGGYFAGIATGLLGFAQVYWDPNRQCVHDKIVGTAVVLAGKEAVPGAWQQAAGYSAVQMTPDPDLPPTDPS